MSDPAPTDHLISQGRALVRAIEALGTIEHTGPVERGLARVLMAAYKRRLRAIVKVAPTWVSEEILSASERIGDKRAALWMSEDSTYWLLTFAQNRSTLSVASRRGEAALAPGIRC